jgi:hypothetical protein
MVSLGKILGVVSLEPILSVQSLFHWNLISTGHIFVITKIEKYLLKFEMCLYSVVFWHDHPVEFTCGRSRVSGVTYRRWISNSLTSSIHYFIRLSIPTVYISPSVHYPQVSTWSMDHFIMVPDEFLLHWKSCFLVLQVLYKPTWSSTNLHELPIRTQHGCYMAVSSTSKSGKFTLHFNYFCLQRYKCMNNLLCVFDGISDFPQYSLLRRHGRCIHRQSGRKISWKDPI